MSELKLQEILEELGKDTYDISLRLGARLTVRARQESLSKFPRNDLEVFHSGKTDFIPICTMGIPLKSADDSLARAVNGDVEVLVGTPEEVREQLSGGMQSGRMYFILTFDSESPVLTEEKKDEVKQQAIKVARSMAQSQIDERMSYLKRLSDYLIPELRKTVKDHIDTAANEDRRLVEKYDKGNEEIERVRNFIDISSKLRFWGRLLNGVSFGKFGNILLKEVDQYAERDVAWRTLEQTADRMYKALQEDVAYLAGSGDNDLSRQLDNVASFYGKLSQQAAYGHTRMSRLIERAVLLYRDITQLEAPNVERISSGILDKMSRVDVLHKAL